MNASSRARARLAALSSILVLSVAILSPRVVRGAAGDLLSTIPNPDPGASQFGQSSATDGATVLVGAPFSTTGAFDGGAVYVYSATGVFQERITSPVPAPDEQFGRAVAVSGSTRLVGAPGYTEPVEGAGAAYADDGGSTILLLSSNPGMHDFFGSAVAILPTHWAVSAPYEDFGGHEDAGVVRLFDLTGDEVLVLGSSQPGPAGAFGSSLAAVGPNLLVGGPGQIDGTGFQRGEVELYDFDPSSPEPDGTWLATFEDPGPGEVGAFGTSLASTGAGLRALIGNPTAPGRALLFNADPDHANFGDVLAVLGNPTSLDGSSFGATVAAYGNHLFVAAPQFGPDGVESGGEVYLFDGDEGSATFGVPILTFENPTADDFDFFGTSLAAPDASRLVVGATGQSPDGAIYLFDTASPATPTPTLVTFNLDSGFSDFNITVFGDAGTSFTFQPSITGTITATVFEQGGSEQVLQIVSADLEMADVSSNTPFFFEVTGPGALIQPGRGAPGPPGLIGGGGGFTLFQNSVEFDGTATVTIGTETFVETGGPGTGSIPIDFTGNIMGSGGVFTITAPFNETRTVQYGSGPFEPVVQVWGTASLEEVIPVGLSGFSLD